MSATEFCIRACKNGPGAPAMCQHIYDVMGCGWNMPGNYNPGTFENCHGDSGEVRTSRQPVPEHLVYSYFWDSPWVFMEPPHSIKANPPLLPHTRLLRHPSAPPSPPSVDLSSPLPVPPHCRRVRTLSFTLHRFNHRRLLGPPPSSPTSPRPTATVCHSSSIATHLIAHYFLHQRRRATIVTVPPHSRSDSALLRFSLVGSRL